MGTRLEESLSLFEKIEKISFDRNIGYLEALGFYMWDLNLKPEKLVRLICPKLKELIKQEAKERNMIPSKALSQLLKD